MTVGDDTGCGPVGVEGASEALRELVLAERPTACVFQFERAWGAGPPLVESVAWSFDRDDGARHGFALRQDVANFTLGEDRLEPGSLGPELGDESELLVTDDALVAGQVGRPAATVVWRTGAVLSLVFVGRSAGGPPEREALDLARQQQERILRPFPVGPSDYDDSELSLDDPRIRVPVYWLGRTFSPGGFPQLELASGSRVANGPGNDVRLDYESQQGAGVAIDLWRPAVWRRFLRTRLGRLVRASPCTVRQRVRLRRGHADVFAGYLTPRRPCPRRPFDAVFAHVYLPRAVAAVNVPICFGCVRPGGDAGVYRSVRGTVAVVRGLKLRE